MTPEQWFGLILAAAGLLGAGGTLGGVVVSRRSGVSSHELQARRDTVADRDALIDQLQEERGANRRAIEELRDEVAELRTERDLDAEWAAALVAHIWEGNPPPPPPRPTRG